MTMRFVYVVSVLVTSQILVSGMQNVNEFLQNEHEDKLDFAPGML